MNVVFSGEKVQKIVNNIYLIIQQQCGPSIIQTKKCILFILRVDSGELNRSKTVIVFLKKIR